MTVSESAPVGTSIGKIMAYDRDIGENAEMDYSIEDDSRTFDVITHNETQEGIIILKKVDALFFLLCIIMQNQIRNTYNYFV